MPDQSAASDILEIRPPLDLEPKNGLGSVAGALVSTRPKTSALMVSNKNQRAPALSTDDQLPTIEVIPEPIPAFDQVTLASFISIQSLLVQFSHPQVRADFVNQKFGFNINPDLLTKIDELRWTLLPRWQSGSIVSTNIRSQVAAHHAAELLRMSDDPLLTDSDSLDECLT
jgi:hypothetical protein